jgi:hypothetical protein
MVLLFLFVLIHPGFSLAKKLIIYPVADGYYKQLSLSGCTSHYECVDDEVGSHDGDNTYNYTTLSFRFDSFKPDTFAINDSIPQEAQIDTVKVVETARMYPVGIFPTANLILFLRMNGYNYYTSTILLSQSYITSSRVWTSDPSDGEWTKERLKNLEFGARSSSVEDSEFRLTQIYLEISYREEGGIKRPGSLIDTDEIGGMIR